MLSNFEFRGQEMNGNLDETLWVNCCQKANHCFAATLKIPYFIVKERMDVWVEF